MASFGSLGNPKKNNFVSFTIVVEVVHISLDTRIFRSVAFAVKPIQILKGRGERNSSNRSSSRYQIYMVDKP